LLVGELGEQQPRVLGRHQVGLLRGIRGDGHGVLTPLCLGRRRRSSRSAAVG
jgi:hypothetical protein